MSYRQIAFEREYDKAMRGAEMSVGMAKVDAGIAMNAVRELRTRIAELEALKQYVEIVAERECAYAGWTGPDGDCSTMPDQVALCLSCRARAALTPDATKGGVMTDCGNCHRCLEGKTDDNGWPLVATRMILCPDCGCKRCPKASDHRHECTDSNEPGQPGSVYG